IGLDPIEGSPRLTFNSEILLKGIDFIAVVVGMFAIPEVLDSLRNIARKSEIAAVKNLYPGKQDLKESAAPIGRGSILGFIIGLIPGGSGTVATFLSYDLEKKLS